MNKKHRIKIIPNPLYNFRYGETDTPSPQARVLVYAMDACGIEKIWSREDLRELVFRMMLAFPDLKIANNHFCNSCLFEFRHIGERIKLEAEDLLACLGLHTNNLPGEPMELYSWIDDLEGQLLETGKSAGGKWSLSPRPEEDRLLKKRFAALDRDEEISDEQIHDILIGKYQFPEPEEHASESYDDEEFEELVVYPDQDDIENARFVANDIVDALPEEAFRVFENAGRIHLNRAMQLEQLAVSPLAKDFRLIHVPDEALHKILSHLMGSDYNPDIRYRDLMQSEYAYIEDLAHLIWARYHNLIYCMHQPRVDSRWRVDLRKFDGLGTGNGVNLQQTWDYFRLSEIRNVFKSNQPLL